MPVGAVVGAVGATAVGGAVAASKQASAAKKAADAQIQAGKDANATQLAIYNDQKKLLTPSALSGAQAEARRMVMTGSSVDEANRFLTDTYTAFGAQNPPLIEADWNPQEWLRSTPGYEFNFDQGVRAMDRSAAARGNLFSGNTGLALIEWGQNYADNEWDDLWGQLGELSGSGASSTGTTVNVAGNYGDNVSANQLAMGRARASGYLGAGEAQANFWGNTLPGAIGAGVGIGRSAGWFGK